MTTDMLDGSQGWTKMNNLRARVLVPRVEVLLLTFTRTGLRVTMVTFTRTGLRGTGMTSNTTGLRVTMVTFTKIGLRVTRVTLTKTRMRVECWLPSPAQGREAQRPMLAELA